MTPQPASAPCHVPRSSRWLVAVAASIVLAISFFAFLLSFAVLRDLAARSGVPEGIAWAWPLIVDGSIVSAMLVIFAQRGRSRRTTAWPWTTLIFFALISVIGNGVHTAAAFDSSQGVPMPFAILVGAIPPVGLLMSSEMLVRLMTPGDTIAAPPRPDTTMTAPGSVTASDLATAPIPSAVAPVADDTVTHSDDDTDHDIDDVENDIGRTDADDAVSPSPAPTTHQDPHSPTPSPSPVPNTHTDQIDWIIDQTRAGHTLTKEALAVRLGSSIRTAQRRIAAARERDPDAFAG